MVQENKDKNSKDKDLWEGDKDLDKEIGPPPFFKTWKAMYILVLSVLLGLIILFYLFTQAYS